MVVLFEPVRKIFDMPPVKRWGLCVLLESGGLVTVTIGESRSGIL